VKDYYEHHVLSMFTIAA